MTTIAKKTAPRKSSTVAAAAKVVPNAPTASATQILPVAAEVAKVKKPKLVRDGFTIPKAEFAVIDELKQRASGLSLTTKKSELIRAGIKALAAMNDAAFTKALKAVPAIKTGRPKA